ncbi:MAG: SRPBCC domain-containing protein, partial [Actinomycetales bacterium]
MPAPGVFLERWDELASVTSIDRDFDRLTLTLVVEVMASVERCWRLWADPRQLERWWGPPGYPASVEA